MFVRGLFQVVSEVLNLSLSLQRYVAYQFEMPVINLAVFVNKKLLKSVMRQF